MLSAVDCWMNMEDREHNLGSMRGSNGSGGGGSGTSLLPSGGGTGAGGGGGGGGGSSGESKDAHVPGLGFESKTNERMELVDYVFAEMCGGSSLPSSEPPSTLALASSLASLNVQGQGLGGHKKSGGTTAHAPLSTSSSSNINTATMNSSGGGNEKSSEGVDGLYGSPTGTHGEIHH